MIPRVPRLSRLLVDLRRFDYEEKPNLKNFRILITLLEG